jgi:hypothetical protein
MSRADLLGSGLTLVVGALAYWISGPVAAMSAFIIGIALIVLAHMRKAEEQPEPLISDRLHVSYPATKVMPESATYPIVDFEFRPEAVRIDMSADYIPKLYLEIANRGRSAIEDVRLQPTEYTLKRRTIITGFARQENAAVIREVRTRNRSVPCNIFDLTPMRIEKLGSRDPRPVPELERFYALRFTFIAEDSQIRYAFYKIISTNVPYLSLIESPFGFAAAGSNEISAAVIMNWFEGPNNLIMAHQRSLFASFPEQEYIYGKQELNLVSTG